MQHSCVNCQQLYTPYPHDAGMCKWCKSKWDVIKMECDLAEAEQADDYEEYYNYEPWGDRNQ